MTIKLLIKLAWQSLSFRRGAVLITISAIAVSVFTLLSVQQLRHSAKESFSSTVSGVDLIVGPRTGDVNLLLTTVFRIGHPSQNMSWLSYEHLSNHSSVAWSIPISLGDSHRGFRVVGTEYQFFSHFKYGRSVPLTFSEGKAFTKIHEVVLGASVARELGYVKGQKLVIDHGLGQTSFQTHDTFPFRVSGIMRPTGTPVDNALYVSLASLESIHQSHSSSVDTDHLKPKSISAAMVGLTSKLSTFKVQREINTFTPEPLTAILPGVTLTQLWQMSRGVESVLKLMAKLILIASLLGMAAVIMTTLRERAYEFSVLRTLGARPLAIFFLIQLEALLMSVLGVILGGLMFILSSVLFCDYLAVTYGIDICRDHISSVHGFVALYTITGALIVSAIPAFIGYFRSRVPAGLSY